MNIREILPLLRSYHSLPGSAGIFTASLSDSSQQAAGIRFALASILPGFSRYCNPGNTAHFLRSNRSSSGFTVTKACAQAAHPAAWRSQAPGSRCKCGVVRTPLRSALIVCHWHTAVFAPLRSALTVCHWHTAVFAPLRSALTVCHWHTAVFAPLRSALTVCHWHTAVFAPLRSALTVCHWHTAVFAPPGRRLPCATGTQRSSLRSGRRLPCATGTQRSSLRSGRRLPCATGTQRPVGQLKVGVPPYFGKIMPKY